MLIENYVNIVTRFFNNKEKEEIKKEVNEMIYSSLEEKYGDKEFYNDEEIKVVLKVLGEPNILAIKYSKLPKQIISEKYVPMFYYSLAIALIVVFFMNIFSTVIKMAINYKESWNYLATGFFETVWSLFATLGIVTFIFVLLEYKKKDVDCFKEYDPSPLAKEIKIEKKHYSLVEEIFNIIFTVLFLVLVLFSDLIKIGGISIFEINFIIKMYYLLCISAILSIAKSMISIISRKKRTVLKATIIFTINIANIIIWIFLMMNGNFLTTEIITYWSSLNVDLAKFFIYSWPRALNVIVIIASCAVAIGNTISYFYQLYSILFKNFEKTKKDKILSI